MHRIKKLLGILLVLGIVFFIICDEQGYKIGFENKHIVFNKIEKKSYSDTVIEQVTEPQKVLVYKNSDLIHINYEFKSPKNLSKSAGIDPEFSKRNIAYKNSNSIKINTGFENPLSLRNSAGMDPEFVAKLEKEQAELQAKEERLKYKGPNIISMNGTGKISNIVNSDDKYNKVVEYNGSTHNFSFNKARQENNSDDIVKTDEDMGYFLTNADEDKLATSNFLNLLGDVENEIEGNINNDSFENNETQEQTVEVQEENVEVQEENVEVQEVQEENVEVQENNNEVEEQDSQVNEKQLGSSYDKTIAERYIQEKDIFISYNITKLENIDRVDNVEDEDSVEDEGNDVVQNFGKFIKRKGKYSKKLFRRAKLDLHNIIENNKKTELQSGSGSNSDQLDAETVSDVETVSDAETVSDVETISDIETVSNAETISDAVTEMVKVRKIEKYQLKRHYLTMRYGIAEEQEFVMPNTLEVEENYDDGYTESGMSDFVLEDIISSDEIDINALESENDEFLQQVFKKTNDTKVMNLIVETYLSEYQFVKAKKFIESLSESYLDELDSLLNLRVVFNSFALTSKTNYSTLVSLVEKYKSNNQISEEDYLWYSGVISLMQQNYDRFFDLSNSFTLESHKNFTAKLQGYKDQIAKQMGMPGYYFDTLVALELFNQGLFQPAKVLALYSLQQNSDYILPYQILAYANFLTNSWDTSIEYLKKLVDLDPNNAEKYRFLMGIAYYWDEKYEQSVLMLSLVKKQSLRADAERYLIRDYIYLDQKTRLISIRNKMLGYDNLVASDFYTYFYEAFYRPFSEGSNYQIYAFDTELANKMIRVCSMKLSDEERAVCSYGMIGKNVVLGQFDGLEESLLKLAAEYPQGYLYQALGEYYIQEGDIQKAKAYLLKAVSMTKRTPEVVQIKKLLQKTM